jgi:hypothetical protein
MLQSLPLQQRPLRLQPKAYHRRQRLRLYQTSHQSHNRKKQSLMPRVRPQYHHQQVQQQ